jgi:signal transduction histidine kinase
MSIQKSLTVYITSMLFVCGAVTGGAIYLIVPLYAGLRRQAAALSALNGVIIVILIAGALIILCALICAFVMAALIARGVVPPLKALAGFAEELREGNLDCRIEYARGNEFEPVFREFDAMREKLKNSLTEAAAREESRREMIASLAHDIKTPVTSICAYAEGLKDGIAEAPDTRLRYAETILQKARMVDSLVNDLFLFSKLDIRQDSLALQEVNAADFLRLTFEAAAKTGAYALNLDLDSNSLENKHIMINKTAFERVVQNITQNSVCHARAERVIIDVTARKHEDSALIKITDNGPGVSEEIREHVFDRFYMADKSRSGTGSGLGLTICRRLIQAMNGKIWARSGEAEGFTICISLPLIKTGDKN